MNLHEKTISALKYLVNQNRSMFVPRHVIADKLHLKHETLDELSQYMFKRDYISITKETIRITPQGEAFLQAFLKNEEEELSEDVYNGRLCYLFC